MAAHLNINSLRYKFDEIKEVLTDNIVDLLIISETKLDTGERHIINKNRYIQSVYDKEEIYSYLSLYFANFSTTADI
jgi:hypothetical protein